MGKQCWSQAVLESGSWGHSVLQTPALVLYKSGVWGGQNCIDMFLWWGNLQVKTTKALIKLPGWSETLLFVAVLAFFTEWWSSYMLFLQGQERIIEEAQQISKIQKQVGMQVPMEYEETFKFGLMEVVFEWARGMVSRLCMLCMSVCRCLGEGDGVYPDKLLISIIVYTTGWNLFLHFLVYVLLAFSNMYLEGCMQYLPY